MMLLFALLAGCAAPDAGSDAPTAGDDPPEAPAAPDIEDAGGLDLFDATRLRTFDLRLESEAAQALGMSTPETGEWVEATVAMRGPDGDAATLEGVGVQVKGSMTYVQWPDKASLKVKFDAFVPDRDLYGVEKVAWHNLREDASFLREQLAYHVFRTVGVPASRAAPMLLLDNGVAHWTPNNLYLQVEPVNGDLLERWFADAEGPMWEGESDVDQLDLLECEHGDCTDTTALVGLADAIANASDEDFLDATGAYLDWPAFYRFWAAEAMTQQGDGYTCANRNYHVYRDPTSGKLFFLPWSLDLTFLQADFLAINDRSRLVNRCLLVPECEAAFHAELLAQADAWDAADVVGELDRAKAALDANGLTTEASEAEYALLRPIVAATPEVTRAWVQAHAAAGREP